MLNDLGYALRRLWNRPLATLGVALVLALGLGATVAVVSVLQAVLLRPLPFPEAERLVKVMPEHRETGTLTTVPYPAFTLWRDESRTLGPVALTRSAESRLESNDEPRPLKVAEVSPRYFEVMGLDPVLGRPFLAEDYDPDAPPVVVLSHGLWTRRFAADPAVLGRMLRLDDQAVSVVGVMPPGYRGPRSELMAWHEIWLPLKVDEAAALAEGQWGFGVVARLAPGATLDTARAELDRLAQRLESERSELFRGRGTAAMSLRELVVGDLGRPLGLLLGAVALVLLLACFNVAQLLLAQIPERRREMAVRLALGAHRGQVLRQLAMEGAVLALAAGVFGWALAHWSLDLLVARAPADLPRLDEVGLDGSLLALMALLAFGTVLLASLGPALGILRAQPRLGGNRPNLGGTRRWRRELVIASEVAISLVLVLAAGLVIESLRRLNAEDLGFETQNLVVARLDLPAPAEETTTDRTVDHATDGVATRDARLADLERRLRQIPGVSAAGLLFQEPPLVDAPHVFRFWMPGSPPPEGMMHTAGWLASGGYQKAMGIPLLAGRWFHDDERTTTSTTLVINRRLAERLWPGEPAVGRQLLSGDPAQPREHTVVGVVGDVQHSGPGTEPELAVEMYAPWGTPGRRVVAVARSDRRTEDVATTVRALLREQLPEAAILDLRSGEAIRHTTTARQRFVSTLLSFFAGLALLLAGAGIYGILAMFVHQRRSEIGLRLALGAQGGDVARWLGRRVLAAVLGGMVVGAAGWALAQRWLLAWFHGVSPAEPKVLAVAGVVLLTVTLLSCGLPLRRALGTDPTESLRQD